jgi:hypothetical protein
MNYEVSLLYGIIQNQGVKKQEEFLFRHTGVITSSRI